MEDWAAVPWGSKSFSPRRGRVWGGRGEVEEEEGEGRFWWVREARKRKSWVSSVRSGAGAGGGLDWEASRVGEGGVEGIMGVGSDVLR